MTTSRDGKRVPPGPLDERAIPPGVRHLAGEVFHNVSELEVALLARRWPLRVWDAGTVSRSLKIGSRQAAETLDRLVAVGLLEGVSSGSYRYRPVTPERSQALDALSQLYQSHRQTVLRLLFSRSKGAVSYFPPKRAGR